MDFTHLHCHSTFSFHAGVCSVKDLVSRSKAMGMTSLSLTDTDRMSGLILFYTECLKQGIKPIMGVELTDPRRAEEHIVLLAKNAQGYSDLCEIISERHLDTDHFSFSKILQHPHPNLFIITGFPHLLEIASSTPNRNRLYAELINNSPASRERSHHIEETARRLNLPLVVSNNTYFLDRADWETHKILRSIGLCSTLSRLKPEEYAPPQAWMRSAQQMETLFPRHHEAIANTQRIADQCQADMVLNEWIHPEITVPEGYTPKTYLREVAHEGLEANYGGKPEYPQARKIQEMELQTISKLGYDSYFLMVKQVRDWANQKLMTGFRRPKDCTVLRGSAANSITFYNIGASDLDPIRYDLYFQRFLNEDRASPPDADLDFGWDERDQVQDYFIERWGQERVAILCTTNHFRMRAAFRETAKVFGYSEEQVSELVKKDRGGPSVDAICYHYDYGRILPDDPEVQRIMEHAQKIRGKPRFLGQHPGGILVTNDPIRQRVACEYSGGPKNRIITQVDMHNGIDELGLIKFDILGNGSLSVLRDTLHQLEVQGQPNPEVWDLEKCFADPQTREMLRNGKTRGVFYIESPAQMRLNQKAQAETFEEVTITSSLVRPAGASYTSRFVERHRKAKLGIQDWEFVHPSLEPILWETHDVCAFQEDVTKICHQVAGLSFKKSDRVRKQMNSMHEGAVASEEWQKTASAFIEGCRSHSGLNLEQALELWERVASFSGFSFCKSHSASYAQLSFQCAYLKSRYPAQFLAAVISNNHGFYTRSVYLDEARRFGVRILPMDINASHSKYWGKHNWMRPGLMHVRNLSRKSLDRIQEEKDQNGRFHNLVDFIKRTPIHKKEIEYLIKVGAFDCFGLTQPELISLLDATYGKIHSDAPELFQTDVTLRNQVLHPGLSDYTLTERCLNELHLLGYMISANMLEILDMHPAARNAVPADQIHHYNGRRIKVFGKPISSRIHTVSKDGRLMKFVTMEDKTECMDIIFWPDIYQQVRDTLDYSGPFEIWGKVSEEYGTYTIMADSVREVGWSPAQIDLERAEVRLRKSLPEREISTGTSEAVAA